MIKGPLLYKMSQRCQTSARVSELVIASNPSKPVEVATKYLFVHIVHLSI